MARFIMAVIRICCLTPPEQQRARRWQYGHPLAEKEASGLTSTADFVSTLIGTAAVLIIVWALLLVSKTIASPEKALLTPLWYPALGYVDEYGHGDQRLDRRTSGFPS